MTEGTKRYSYFEKNRKGLSRLLFALALFPVLFTRHSWPSGGTLYWAVFAAGSALTVAGILGRSWCTMYIGGKKNTALVTKGPYSMSRNPLYFFSFVSGLGVCLLLENLLLVAVYVPAFLVLYRHVIDSEEMRLQAMFGDEFVRYKSATPAFLPAVSKFDRGDGPDFTPSLLVRTLRDGSVFLFFIPLALAIDALQERGLLGTLRRIP